MSPLRKVLSIFAILLVAGSGAQAADARPPAKPAVPNVAPMGNGSDLQKLIAQFNSRREVLLADRQNLLNQLKNATAEQRKQILDKMQSQQKDLLDAQRDLAKQIRDEIRRLRESTPGSRRS